MGRMLLNDQEVATLVISNSGGQEIKNQDLTITENGTYSADEGFTGLGTVEVNVPTGGGTEINNQDITVTENGTYTADAGYTGLGTVSVNVQGGGSAERFGVPYDSIVGTVDKDGNYVLPKKTFEVNLSGVKHVSASALQYTFSGKAIKKLIFNKTLTYVK